MEPFFKKLAPILIELNERVDLNQPVKLDTLIDLFKKHSPKKVIRPVKNSFQNIAGMHIGSSETNTALVTFKPCIKPFDRKCPNCQSARFSVAKELVHCLDRKYEKTPPDDALVALINRLLIKRFSTDTTDLSAEAYAEFGAIELLARYESRVTIKGSFSYERSKQQGWTDLASQYCIPREHLAFGFDGDYMEMIAILREESGLRNP